MDRVEVGGAQNVFMAGVADWNVRCFYYVLGFRSLMVSNTPKSVASTSGYESAGQRVLVALGISSNLKVEIVLRV